MDIFFKIDKWGAEPFNNKTDKGDEVAWFDLNRLPSDAVGYLRNSLEQIKSGDFYSNYGWDL